ncbi:hypothetical protein UAY_01823 [Enterococcus moraviensis ATCC BAA-383]|uniref:Lipoprotein n=1 Tax=Enterococcus moraviensis ATCC BAA-383 TaxID=1158609 RepID=R2QW10_9ENTE|nr:hypothetical protein [Enterococcus moraviensis]EOI00720.1 hypothetical protein UAY_01823 [Enterococcus moraviensis ATCC BAA-383]EOT73051.1 hypothetical protein I586_00044 [Enterococcus moraviensis ATCC BAA-383]OJG68613.1 hypothetical protein RV09_GL000012 [Enterococcus moraviensis]
MKKILVAIVLVALFIVGCSNKSDDAFVQDIANALESRWKLTDNASNDKKVDQAKKGIDAELNIIDKYENKDFKNLDFSTLSKEYIRELNNGLSIIKTYGDDISVFYPKWTDHQSNRSKILNKINDISEIKVSPKYQDMLKEVLNYKIDDSDEHSSEPRKEFFIIDTIINSHEIGNQVMSYKDYQSFVEGKLTLEGIVTKYGVPSHVIGGEEGDSHIEVCYPTDETGYSADLVFENKKTGFGDWVLSKKSVVETDGIGFEKYTKQ